MIFVIDLLKKVCVVYKVFSYSYDFKVFFYGLEVVEKFGLDL